MEKLPLLLLPLKEGYKLLRFNDLVYAKAEGSYVRVKTAGGESALLTGKLKQLQEILNGPEFLRCHHSWLVNLHFVKGIKTDEGAWGLQVGEDTIPVSKEKRRGLMERLHRL